MTRKPSQREQDSGIVADGGERALDGAREILAQRHAEIVARVEAAYATRLAEAGFVRRWWLRLQMRGEIRRDMQREEQRVAPNEALYLKQ